MKPGPSWPLINILFLFFKCSNSESEGDEQESGFPTVAERLRLDVEDLRNKVIYIHVTYIHYFNLWLRAGHRLWSAIVTMWCCFAEQKENKPLI